jgi:hypothetical protein
LELVSIEGSKIRPARATKGSQTYIVGFLFEENLRRRRKLQDLGSLVID